MAPHKQRVVAERDELQTKIRKLAMFFDTDTFGGLEYEDRKLLSIQHSTMTAYCEVLNTRIGRFT